MSDDFDKVWNTFNFNQTPGEEEALEGQELQLFLKALC